MRAAFTEGSSRAFSLLEVMVAVGILGLTLTVILSAQGGLAASNKMAANMGIASTIARCKMTEMEEKLTKLGYPAVEDIQSDVACCNDNSDNGFLCDTKVEKVILPNPPTNSMDAGGGLSLSSLSSAASSPSGALGAIAPGLGGNAAGGAGLDFDGGLQGLGAGLMQQLGAGSSGATGMGMQGLMQMVMGMVYPSLKLMFEASIRRLTVTVKWHEGPNPKEFALTQYVSNPQQAGFAAGAPSASGSTGGANLNAPPPGTLPGGGLSGGVLH
jgi:general secretion pathway protein I